MSPWIPQEVVLPLVRHGSLWLAMQPLPSLIRGQIVWQRQGCLGIAFMKVRPGTEAFLRRVAERYGREPRASRGG
jgi:hypothetical protein